MEESNLNKKDNPTLIARRIKRFQGGAGANIFRETEDGFHWGAELFASAPASIGYDGAGTFTDITATGTINASGGTISGDLTVTGSLTGGTIQTASSGYRIKLDGASGELKFLNGATELGAMFAYQTSPYGMAVDTAAGTEFIIKSNNETLGVFGKYGSNYALKFYNNKTIYQTAAQAGILYTDANFYPTTDGGESLGGTGDLWGAVHAYNIRCHTNFISSDNTGGVTANVTEGGTTFHFKNGLFVGT